MLRSRSNRKQFPSESTDERHGRTNSDHHGHGYPSHQPKSPLAVTIGCDDDIESHNYAYSIENNISSNYHHHSSPGGTVISMNGGSSINNFSNISKSSGGVVRRSPSNGPNISGNHAAAASAAAATMGGCSSPMATAGSPIMGGGIGPSSNNNIHGSHRRGLPGYGNHPNLSSSGPIVSSLPPSRRSSSIFTERLNGISSPIMKSPRQLHMQQQQYYARGRRMKLFIGGLALLASVYCLALKLGGEGEEGGTAMDQYRAFMQRMVPQEMMLASWKALVSGKGNDEAASAEDINEVGDNHNHHHEQNHHQQHHQQQHDMDPLKQVLEQLQHKKQQMESEIQLLREKYHKMNSEVQIQQEQLNGVQLKIKEEESKLMEYHKENSNNEKYRVDREKQLVVQQQEQQQREEVLRDRIKLLSDNIGKESRRAVLESFGPGPHVVELFLEFPQYHPNVDLDSWPRVRGKLTLEMAPLDFMPVSVNLFLQQIHHKLWNGCAFVVNAEHILQAGPHLPTSDGKEYTLKSPEIVNRFQESGLMELPFQEYREEYPHEQYTIGYAGRPGGMNWYINKVNNTLNHGPGGQRHYNSMIDEADPCFAKVVSGWDVLEYIEKLPSENARLVRPVVIADSRVIRSSRSEQPQQQHQEQQQPQQDQQRQQQQPPPQQQQ